MPPSEDSASSIDVSFLAALSPAELRGVLPGFLASFVADEAAARANRERMTPLVASWSDETCARVLRVLGALGEAHHLYPADPTCRELSRAWSRDVVLSPRVEGAEHLAAAVRRGPTLVACNHLSYFDTTATDAVLSWSGHTDLADRLVAAAGPKVYQDLFRRVAAACLNTLPVPQSTSFAHTEKLAPRELARKVAESTEAAGVALREGYVLLLYPEGSRSRTGRLGPFLKGVHRYLTSVDGITVVPAAIVGTEVVMPVEEHRLHPGPVTLRFAPGLTVGVDGASREILDLAHQAVASLLPEARRPLADAPPSV